MTGQPTGSTVWLDGSCIACKLQKGINVSVEVVLGMELFFISVKMLCMPLRKKYNKKLSKKHYEDRLV